MSKAYTFFLKFLLPFQIVSIFQCHRLFSHSVHFNDFFFITLKFPLTVHLWMHMCIHAHVMPWYVGDVYSGNWKDPSFFS